MCPTHITVTPGRAFGHPRQPVASCKKPVTPLVPFILCATPCPAPSKLAALERPREHSFPACTALSLGAQRRAENVTGEHLSLLHGARQTQNLLHKRFFYVARSKRAGQLLPLACLHFSLSFIKPFKRAACCFLTEGTHCARMALTSLSVCPFCLPNQLPL